MRTGALTGITWLAAVVLIALSTAGCGGKSEPATTASTTASKQSETATATTPKPKTPKPKTDSVPGFIAAADAVCRGLNTKLAAEKAKSSSAKEYVRVVTRNVALEREGVSELERLSPPSALQRDWRLMQGYRQRLVTELSALLADAEKNQLKKAKPLIASKHKVHKQLHDTAKGAGFKDCAEVGVAG